MRLRGVDVRLAEVSGARIHVDEVEVSYGANGRAIALHGGLVSPVGPREDLLRQVEAWRARHTAEGASSSEGRGGASTELTGLRLTWQDDPSNVTEEVSADDLRLARRADGRITIAARNGSILVGGTRLDVQNGQLELVRREDGYRVGAISADAVEAQINAPAGGDPAVPRGKALLAGDAWARFGGTLRETLLRAARTAERVVESSPERWRTS